MTTTVKPLTADDLVQLITGDRATFQRQIGAWCARHGHRGASISPKAIARMVELDYVTALAEQARRKRLTAAEDAVIHAARVVERESQYGINTHDAMHDLDQACAARDRLRSARVKAA